MPDVFTGLVEALGRVERVDRGGCGDPVRRSPGMACRPTIPSTLGESIAVNGCCLTVVAADGERFEVQAGPETLVAHQPRRRRAGRPREPRAGPAGRRPPGRPLRPGARRHHRDPPRAPARGRVGVPRLRDRPGLDPAAGPQGLDRRRRRQPDAGRRRARRVLRHAHPPHPGRDHARPHPARRRASTSRPTCWPSTCGNCSGSERFEERVSRRDTQRTAELHREDRKKSFTQRDAERRRVRKRTGEVRRDGGRGQRGSGG